MTTTKTASRKATSQKGAKATRTSSAKGTSAKATSAKVTLAVREPRDETEPSTNPEADVNEAGKMENDAVEAADTTAPDIEPMTDAEPTASEPVPADESIPGSTPDKPVKPKRPASPEYEQACQEVSRANRLFHEALSERAALLGTELKGESCNINAANPELARLSAEIKAIKQRLNELTTQRRQLLNASPELEAINRKVSEYRKQRQLARQSKKRLAAEIGI